MNNEEKTILFKENYATLVQQSRKFSNIYGVEYDEVFSEASLIFVESCDKYDSNKKCNFNTYLTHQLRKLNRYCKSYVSFGEVEQFPVNILYNMSTTKDNFVTLLEFDSTIISLSSLAKRIVNLAYDPVEMMELNEGKRITKKMIENYLMGMNYTRQSIRFAFDEIKLVI